MLRRRFVCDSELCRNVSKAFLKKLVPYAIKLAETFADEAIES